jgi:glycosyltransferase involved in cell wall biosynthesis
VAISRGRGPGAALRVVGLSAMGRRDTALAWAEGQAADPATPVSTRIALARAALALRATPTVGRILRTIPAHAEGQPEVLVLRADLALLTGRYEAAAALAERARAAGGAGRRLGAIEARAASELRVLEPGWRPRLRARTSTLDPVRGRVLHLITNSLPHRQAGYTVRSQSIGLAQREAGLDPHFATQAGFPGSLRGLVPREDVDGVPYHRLAPSLDRTAGPAAIVEATAQAAVGLVEQVRPAVLHPATNFLNAQAALALRDAFGLPIVYEVRGFLEETWASRQADDAAADAVVADRYRGARAAETACMLAADAVVTLSETMRADIVERGCAADRVVVVPNAVDVERFVPAARDDALAGRLGLQPDETVLGYVSSFIAYEGIRYLIEATALLRARGRRVRLLLVGDGEERAALETCARELGLLETGVVLFTGRVPHTSVLAHYGLIDVFVVPRTTDRVSQLVTPLKPYEAMALERALVVSDVAALREIVVPGETGLVFRAEDAADLADTVEPLLDDARQRAALGREARRWVTANRTWRQNGQRYLELYRRLGVA